MKTHYLKKDDPWPEAVSDGLTLPCGVCGTVPVIDYHIPDNIWKKIVPKKLKLGVICLNCLVNMDPDVVSSIENIFVCGGGRTILLKPETLYDYRSWRRWQQKLQLD